MTATVVDPATADAIRRAARCEIHLDIHTACGKPAAWLVTFTYHSGGHRTGPIVMCPQHRDEIVNHVADCPVCEQLYDVDSEPLR